MKLLFSTPDHSFLNEAVSTFEDKSVEFISTGREAQLKLAQGDIDFLILDSKIENHSFLYVLKYTRINCPSTDVILLFEDRKQMESMEYSEKELKGLGIKEPIFSKNYIPLLEKIINKSKDFEKWKIVDEIDIEEASKKNNELVLTDTKLTKIEVDEFYSGNTSIFDVFLKLNKNRYLKILNKGERFNKDKLKEYTSKCELGPLYFKTEDRASYVNYINTLISTSKSKSPKISQKKTRLLSSISKKYLEEVYTKGLDKNLYQEGIKICDNIYETLLRSEKTSQLLQSVSEHSTSNHFLTAIFSIAIAKRVDWAGEKTISNLTQGSMLYDIGLVKFKWYRDNNELSFEQMSKSQRRDYFKHPELGYEMLEDIEFIPEAVRQITLQHRECIDGSGFPNNLTNQKIYPLAKIISLSRYMSSKIIEKKISPLDVLREFIPNKEETNKFEPAYIKALIRSFVADE